jgi:hypothetical protein
VEEKLFPSREDKIAPTVNTLQHLVLKFHLRMAPFSPSPRAHSRGKNCGGTPEIQVVYYSPSKLPLGLGPPRVWNAAWVKTFIVLCRENW